MELEVLQKKYLPIILLLIGAAVLTGAFFFVKSRRTTDTDKEEESTLIEVAPKDRPVVSLTPTTDGHYLKLRIEKLLSGAESLDYELLYQTSDNITQGVPGTLALGSEKEFETDLLLGTESSGKFRYDEGVETGSVALRFRNKEGKLLAKFESEFHLTDDNDKLTSLDDNFKTISYTP